MNAPLEPIAADDAVAIGRLVAEFHYLIDQGQASECLALLAEDARLVFGPGSPNPGEIAGREAIEAFLTARQSAPVTTRHLLGQTRLAVLGPGRIGALTILALFKAPSCRPRSQISTKSISEPTRAGAYRCAKCGPLTGRRSAAPAARDRRAPAQHPIPTEENFREAGAV